MAADDTDYTKFPITARDTIFEVGDSTFQVENKFPMTDNPYGSRLSSQIALPISERQNTKNYHLLGFAPQRALQAEDLNEIQERFMVNNTLTQQMWSNWNSFNNMQMCEFGPGWFGTTPLHPYEWKSNIRYLDEFIYAPGNADDLIFEKPKNLITIDHKEFFDNVPGAGGGFRSNYTIQLTLNPGWYYINDTYTTSSTHDSSGFKYWYYLKETIHSEEIVVDVVFRINPFGYTVTSPSHPQEIYIENNGTCDVHVELPFGIILDDINYVSGGEFQSGDSDSGADRVEIKIKPKLGSGTSSDRTPSYIGYITFETPCPFPGSGATIGFIRAKYLNNVPLDLSSLNRVDGMDLDTTIAGLQENYENTILPDATTEFI